MSLDISSLKLACYAAAFLAGVALLVVFALHPGGFESQGAWLFVLLPAGIAVYPLSDFVYKVAPHAEPVVFWTLMATLDFMWYWVVSYVVLRIFRNPQ